MKILIVDKFFQKRDPAQMDMYVAIAGEHYVTFSTNPIEDVITGNYDILYLGIYHQSLDIDLYRLLHYNTMPVIIDQADNEEWVDRNKIPMGKNIKWVLSRYLPNDRLETYCLQHGFPLALLTWYVNPDRFYTSKEKLYDLSFVCSMYGKRLELSKNIKGHSIITNKSYITGEYFGKDYVDILAKSYMAYMECGRKCMTQKYIEASLADCVLIGDKPLYPENELIVHNHIPDNYTNMVGNRDYVLQTFANRKVFINRFNELLA